MARSAQEPPRDGILLFVAIFLLFAPVGVLLGMVQPEPVGWLLALFGAIFSGLLAVGWSYTSIRRRWWLVVPLFFAPFVIPAAYVTALERTGLIDVGNGLSPQARMIVLACMCVVFTALGFTLFVVHHRITERKSARAQAELEVAAKVHATLVPPIDLTTRAVEVYGRSMASSSMGGDLIDAISEPGEGLGGCVHVLVGDVSGHGVGAGIVMAMLKSCVRMRLVRDADLGEVVGDVNRILAELTASDMFATFAALRIAGDGTRVDFALAGHLPIFHFRAADRRWDRHPNQSLPLGIDGEERFTAGASPVRTGDILAIFTDGLSEVQNAAGRELGIEGVATLLASGAAVSLEAMHRAVMAGVASHGPQLDDQSLVLVRIR